MGHQQVRLAPDGHFEPFAFVEGVRLVLVREGHSDLAIMESEGEHKAFVAPRQPRIDRQLTVEVSDPTEPEHQGHPCTGRGCDVHSVGHVPRRSARSMSEDEPQPIIMAASPWHLAHLDLARQDAASHRLRALAAFCDAHPDDEAQAGAVNCL
jgi:hypothetical protein